MIKSKKLFSKKTLVFGLTLILALSLFATSAFGAITDHIFFTNSFTDADRDLNWAGAGAQHSVISASRNSTTDIVTIVFDVGPTVYQGFTYTGNITISSTNPSASITTPVTNPTTGQITQTLTYYQNPTSAFVPITFDIVLSSSNPSAPPHPGGGTLSYFVNVP
jgi:hypothetical protein